MEDTKNHTGPYFRAFVAMAEAYFDGHYTLMKFTTHFRACLGTPHLPVDGYDMPDGRYRKAIAEMPEGNSLEEACRRAIDRYMSLSETGTYYDTQAT